MRPLSSHVGARPSIPPGVAETASETGSRTPPGRMFVGGVPGSRDDGRAGVLWCGRPGCTVRAGRPHHNYSGGSRSCRMTWMGRKRWRGSSRRETKPIRIKLAGLRHPKREPRRPARRRAAKCSRHAATHPAEDARQDPDAEPTCPPRAAQAERPERRWSAGPWTAPGARLRSRPDGSTGHNSPTPSRRRASPRRRFWPPSRRSNWAGKLFEPVKGKGRPQWNDARSCER